VLLSRFTVPEISTNYKLQSATDRSKCATNVLRTGKTTAKENISKEIPLT